MICTELGDAQVRTPTPIVFINRFKRVYVI